MRDLSNGKRQKDLTGIKIRSLVEFAGVPKGSTGIAEWDEELNHYLITWDSEKRWFGTKYKALQDGFDKGEFEKYLEKI